ncbi:hypothetical protein M1N07_03010, partial [Thermodesulfovibrionales bacterium]|nr:hypothetical protein [Thermodesulfovibrionales bacterium]
FIVDFGREVIPIEAKYKKMNKPRVERSMKTFIEKYKPKESWVVNLNFEKEIEIEKTKVKFLPFHRIY